jgi:hypothetical protein
MTRQQLTRGRGFITATIIHQPGAAHGEQTPMGKIFLGGLGRRCRPEAVFIRRARAMDGNFVPRQPGTAVWTRHRQAEAPQHG